MKINDIDFEIKSVEMVQDTKTLSYGFNTRQIPGPQHITLNAETHNSNYMKLSDWFDSMFYGQTLTGTQTTKKININYNSIQISGLYPRDYTFEQNTIKVTFSIDHISGDIRLFNDKLLRKEKLKKINSINENKDK